VGDHASVDAILAFVYRLRGEAAAVEFLPPMHSPLRSVVDFLAHRALDQPRYMPQLDAAPSILLFIFLYLFIRNDEILI